MQSTNAIKALIFDVFGTGGLARRHRPRSRSPARAARDRRRRAGPWCTTQPRPTPHRCLAGCARGACWRPAPEPPALRLPAEGVRRLVRLDRHVFRGRMATILSIAEVAHLFELAMGEIAGRPGSVAGTLVHAFLVRL